MMITEFLTSNVE